MDKKNFFATNSGKAVVIIIGYIVILGLMLLFIELGYTVPMYIIAAVCVFFGWKFLNRITPSMFLWLSFTGWIVYFFVKLFLSVAVGVFVAPFQIAKMIANLIGESVE